MTIVCDLDNTINNLHEAVVNLFNERHKTNYTINDFHDYSIENNIPIKDATAMKKMYNEDNIYSYVVPIPGASDAIQKLIHMGHKVYIVSDCTNSDYNEKQEWLNHFFPFIDNDHIVSMKHKHLLRSDIMIEDNLLNLLSGAHYHRVCIDSPWNRDVHDYVYDIHRCQNWRQVVDVINKIEKEESERN